MPLLFLFNLLQSFQPQQAEILVNINRIQIISEVEMPEKTIRNLLLFV